MGEPKARHNPLFPRANQFFWNLAWAVAGGAVVYVLVVLRVLPVLQVIGGE